MRNERESWRPVAARANAASATNNGLSFCLTRLVNCRRRTNKQTNKRTDGGREGRREGGRQTGQGHARPAHARVPIPPSLPPLFAPPPPFARKRHNKKCFGGSGSFATQDSRACATSCCSGPATNRRSHLLAGRPTKACKSRIRLQVAVCSRTVSRAALRTSACVCVCLGASKSTLTASHGKAYVAGTKNLRHLVRLSSLTTVCRFSPQKWNEHAQNATQRSTSRLLGCFLFE